MGNRLLGVVSLRNRLIVVCPPYVSAAFECGKDEEEPCAHRVLHEEKDSMADLPGDPLTHQQSIVLEGMWDTVFFHSCVLSFKGQGNYKQEILGIFVVLPHRVPAYCWRIMNKSHRNLTVCPRDTFPNISLSSQALNCQGLSTCCFDFPMCWI